MKNRWKDRLFALADEEVAAGRYLTGNTLRRWANGQCGKDVSDSDSFSEAMICSGYGVAAIVKNALIVHGAHADWSKAQVSHVANLLYRHGFGREGSDLYDPKNDACGILLRMATRSVPRECVVAMCHLIAAREAAGTVVKPYADCSKAIQFVNEHFMDDKANGQLHAGQDTADAIIFLLRELLNHRANNHRADGKRAEFFMLYREGGRAPTYKHADVEDARREAKRIANESGETVHVLAKVDAVAANTRPSDDEFASHATCNGWNVTDAIHSSRWGLWRVVVPGRPPLIVPVKSDSAGARVSPESHLYAGGSPNMFPSEARWFPLDARGKELESDIPF